MFLTSLLFVITTYCCGQGTFSYSKLVNNYWGSYQYCDGYLLFYQPQKNEFIIYYESGHPSDYIMRVTWHGNLYDADKKSRKEHYKKKEWYTLVGNVEIFSSPQTFIEDFPLWASRPSFGGKSTILPATIRIAPYKKRPTDLNILFDNYGIAISGN